MSKKIKVPRVITRERLGDSDFEAAYEGALKHGKHLAKAEDQLTTATDLSHVLLAFLSQIDDGGFYAAGVMEVLIKRLSKARDLITSTAESTKICLSPTAISREVRNERSHQSQDRHLK